MTRIFTNPLILIDGFSYLYRAYYAFPALTNSINESTNAIYGFLSMLRSLILKYQPSHMAIVFDAQGKTFRDNIFLEYKSHRKPMPDDLRKQIKPLHQILHALGMPLIIVSGVEADDVIGTIAQLTEHSEYNVLISTKDKDMAQLVTPRIKILHNLNYKILGPQEIYDKYGVPPKLIIDLLALMGDASDNIPGVPNIGEKTAKILLQKIGNIQQIYSQLDKILTLNLRGAKKIINTLKLNQYQAELSYLLATIKTDIKLNIQYNDLKIKPINTVKIYELFKQYEFNIWLKQIKIGSWLKNTKYINNI